MTGPRTIFDADIGTENKNDRGVLEVEVSETGEFSGWCSDLRQLDLFECDGDCSHCWCG